MSDRPVWWEQLMVEPILTIDPRRAGSCVCIAGTRIEAEAIGWYAYHEGVDDVMADYSLTRHQVLVACWWLAHLVIDRPPSRRNKDELQLAEAWLEWLNTHGVMLHGGSPDLDELPDPPMHDEPAKKCRWFQWIGQSFANCEGCSRPAWEHEGMHHPGSPFTNEGERFTPWEPGEADAIEAKWGGDR